MSGRFVKGQSGNPNGRPRQRRPNVSAFDIIFDKTLTVSQGGVERELSVDEALQMQTYQAALQGSKMAMRAVLKMIERREAAIRKRAPKMPAQKSAMTVIYDSDSADDAMRILGIIEDEIGEHWNGHCRRTKVALWAAQSAISRPGRKRLSEKEISDVQLFTVDPEKLCWPRRRAR